MYSGLHGLTLGGPDEAKRVYKDFKLSKSSKMFAAVDALRLAKHDDIESLQRLERAAADYVELRKDDTDRSTLEKLEWCKKMVVDARLAQVRARHPDTRYYTRDQIQAMKVEILLATGRITRPDEATGSDSFFLRESDGKPRFIFKPQEGESGEAGFPKGGGAPREILFSQLNDAFSKNLGIDFGVCPTTAMRLDHGDFLTRRITQTRMWARCRSWPLWEMMAGI